MNFNVSLFACFVVLLSSCASGPKTTDSVVKKEIKKELGKIYLFSFDNQNMTNKEVNLAVVQELSRRYKAKSITKENMLDED